VGKAKRLHWWLYPNLDFANNAVDSDRMQEHYAQKNKLGIMTPVLLKGGHREAH
jgi:hypothetical protein